jgi:hypothetical protein
LPVTFPQPDACAIFLYAPVFQAISEVAARSI